MPWQPSSTKVPNRLSTESHCEKRVFFLRFHQRSVPGVPWYFPRLVADDVQFPLTSPPTRAVRRDSSSFARLGISSLCPATQRAIHGHAAILARCRRSGSPGTRAKAAKLRRASRLHERGFAARKNSYSGRSIARRCRKTETGTAPEHESKHGTVRREFRQAEGTARRCGPALSEFAPRQDLSLAVPLANEST